MVGRELAQGSRVVRQAVPARARKGRGVAGIYVALVPGGAGAHGAGLAGRAARLRRARPRRAGGVAVPPPPGRRHGAAADRGGAAGPVEPVRGEGPLPRSSGAVPETLPTASGSLSVRKKTSFRIGAGPCAGSTGSRAWTTRSGQPNTTSAGTSPAASRSNWMGHCAGGSPCGSGTTPIASGRWPDGTLWVGGFEDQRRARTTPSGAYAPGHRDRGETRSVPHRRDVPDGPGKRRAWLHPLSHSRGAQDALGSEACPQLAVCSQKEGDLLGFSPFWPKSQ